VRWCICGAKPPIASSSVLRYQLAADRRASSVSALKPKAQSVVSAVCRAKTEASIRHRTRPRVVAYPRTRRKGLRQTPAEAGERRTLHRVGPGRSPGVPDEAALSVLATEVVSAVRAPLSITARAVPPRWFGSRDERQKLPPVQQRPKSLGKRKTRSRTSDNSSLGVRFLSAFKLRRSLRRFTSPTPSVLRVSHPLNGLIPPEPRGLVSCHIHP
jgi:hypothetical protein